MKYPVSSDKIKCYMLFDSPVATSSVMLRSDLLKSNNLIFDTQFIPSEDYDLWERLSHVTEIANIPSYLTSYRIHPTQTVTSSIGKIKHAENSWRIRNRGFQQLQLNADENGKKLHLSIGLCGLETDKEYLFDLEKWFKLILMTNRSNPKFNDEILIQVVLERWFRSCFAVAFQFGLFSWNSFWKSELIHLTKLFNIKEISIIDIILFAIKCLSKSIFKNRFNKINLVTK
jgi:hypothetical protein